MLSEVARDVVTLSQTTTTIASPTIVVIERSEPWSLLLSAVAVAIAGLVGWLTIVQGRAMRRIESREHEWQAIDRLRLRVVGMLLMLGGCVGEPVRSQAATVTTFDTCTQVEALEAEYLDQWAAEERRIKEEASEERDRAIEEGTSYIDRSGDVLFDNALAYWERIAILAEEHPVCFTLTERTEIEAEYRAGLRAATERQK
jgi:hypothetical protein